MRVTRFDWDGGDPRSLAGELRALQPPLEEVADAVAAIVADVADRGDAAVLEAERSFGAAEPEALAPSAQALQSAAERIPVELRHALELAAENIRRVSAAEGKADVRVTLRQEHSVRLRSVAVGVAGAYVPGGGGAYPSTALMCCVPARVAGVERVAIATPPGPDGRVPDAVLAAAAIGGADRLYTAGGAQAIAALALGTESVEPVDVVVGPGNRYVQEAKRQLFGRVGIDGIAGPSELMVICDDSAPSEWIALDLCAQAEHGGDGLLAAAAAEDRLLEALEAEVTRLAGERESLPDAPLALVRVPSLGAGVELANALAPEHLQIACVGNDELSLRARTPGCVFIGPRAATAFGDYAAGSNHVLPTGGTGRFTGPLGPSVFRRRIATVKIPEDAARELAPSVATLARSEGFELHAESAEMRGRPANE